MKDIASMMADSASTLEVIEESSFEGQDGKAVRKLQASIGAFPLELQLAAGAYRQVGQALVDYGDVLEQEKPRIDREAEDCEELWRAYAALPGDRYGNTDPDVAGIGPGAALQPVTPESQQVAEDNQAKKDAYDAWEEAAEAFDRYYDNWQQGYDDAVAGITTEVSGSIVDSFWSSMLGHLVVPKGASDRVLPYLLGKDLPASAKGMADLWSTLNVADKAALAERYPNLGNRGGIPAAERDLLNRTFMEETTSGIEHQITDLEERLSGMMVAPGHQAERYALEEQVEELQAELDEYAGVEKGLAGDNRYLLHLDDEGRVAIGVNNPDTADNVATYVPGVGSELSNIDAGVVRAQGLVHQAKLADGGSTAAAIAWYGYGAPSLTEVFNDGTVSVYSTVDAVTRQAEDGAPRLEAFQDGLGASHEAGAANVTVIGHSYGSTVVGRSAADGLRADHVIFLGSPGVMVEDVTDLRLIDGSGDPIPADRVGDHVYAGKAENDDIPKVADLNPLFAPEGQDHGPLGHDPTDPDFGARGITSDPGPEWWFGLPTVDAHTQYLDEGATTLKETGPVIAGKER